MGLARVLLDHYGHGELRGAVRGGTAVCRRCVVAAGGVVALRAVAAWFAGSLGVLAAGLDSLLDAALSGLNWFSTLGADRPADPEHPFGHGKVESLVGSLQAVLIAVVALVIGLQAVERLFVQRPVTDTGWGVAAMLVSELVALYL